VRVFAVEALEIGIPHARSLIVVDKSAAKKSSAKEPEQTVSYFLSSRLPSCAEGFARLIRGHWAGCEIRNHWVRDVLYRGRDGALVCAIPPTEPDWRISRIRLSSWLA
jgi:hypothetical protein